MRELGVSVMWPKLQHETFTTFRFPRRDKDWQVGETVRVVFHPRGRDRKVLGTAKISGNEPRTFDYTSPNSITAAEAHEDGFRDRTDMKQWMKAKYGAAALSKSMNRLTIQWITKEVTP
jgi:hypothetical protein